MVIRTAVACFLAAIPLVAQQEQEHRKVPKDSVLVTVTGCLKGRVIRASDVTQPDTTSGIVIRNRAFRISGKKELMNAVKEQDGHLVQLTGLIRKSALIEPGVKFKGGRVVVGGGSIGGTASSLPDPAENVVVLDAETMQAVGGSCGG
jgi:hypothetical protein